MPLAKDFMQTELIVLARDTSVHDAMALFLEHDISGAPVVDEQGSVVGILTERDCLDVIYRACYHKGPGELVRDTMKAPVATLDAEADLIDVIEAFRTSRYRRFPVLAGTRLVGLISRRDIVRAALELW